ncbi:MAG: hypothetical protein ACRC6V_07800 [Bacteroidales bacterium]
MFFSDETRIGSTASPTTYTVGDDDPNVSQYGWTKTDKSHYNQLIGYVNECRDILDKLILIGGYSEQALKELVRLEGQALYIDRNATTVANNTAQVKYYHDQTAIMHGKIDVMLQSITAISNSVNDKYTTILALEKSATDAADSATISSGQSIDYYLKTKALYDEWKASQP